MYMQLFFFFVVVFLFFKKTFSCDDIHKASSHIFIMLDLKYEEYLGFFAVSAENRKNPFT